MYVHRNITLGALAKKQKKKNAPKNIYSVKQCSLHVSSTRACDQEGLHTQYTPTINYIIIIYIGYNAKHKTDHWHISDIN